MGESKDENKETLGLFKVPRKDKEEKVLVVDKNFIFYRGFMSLTEQEKASVLTSFLLKDDTEFSELTSPEDVEIAKGKLSLWKDKQDFLIKQMASGAGLAMAVILFFGLVGLIVWMVVHDAGKDNSIVNTTIGSIFDFIKTLLGIFIQK